MSILLTTNVRVCQMNILRMFGRHVMYGTPRSCLPRSASSSVIVKKLPFEVDVNVQKEVLLFKYDNLRFFRMIRFFAVTQFFFWSYLSYFAYTGLRDVPIEDQEKQLRGSWGDTAGTSPVALSWWRKINLGENKYRNGITVLCATIGCTLLASCCLYTLRSVKTLTLLKGGEAVRLVTYSPWGRHRILEVPVHDLNCNVRRTHTSHLPIKVRRYALYFLLDKDGTYTNTKLFDHTAGLKRLWAAK